MASFLLPDDEGRGESGGLLISEVSSMPAKSLPLPFTNNVKTEKQGSDRIM